MTATPHPERSPSRWDAAALRAGGSVALAIAVPLSIVAGLLDEDNGLRPWIGFLALLAFVVGAGVAAWHQEKRAPYSHGIVASVGAYSVAQFVLIVYSLITGGGVEPLQIVSALTFTAVAGTVGGLLGSIVQRSGVRSQYRN